MAAIADLVHEVSTSTGTGNITTAPVNGKQTFDTAFGHGATTNVFHYFISSRDAAEYEWGTGHMSDATTLVRDTVLGGSNGTSAVSFTSGTKDVTNDIPSSLQTKVIASRETLTTNRTYYVRTDGSDSNNGLSDTSAGAFLTIQKAVDVIIGTMDFSGNTVTIQVADGTYTSPVSVGQGVGISSASKFVIKGNASAPGNVIISTTSASCFTAISGGFFTVKDMELRTTTAGDCLRAQDGAIIEQSGVRFGACARYHQVTTTAGRITAVGAYSVVGSALIHAYAANGAIRMAGQTVTLSGTPNFSTAYAYADRNGLIDAAVMAFSGSATGVRYTATNGGGIYTFGGGPNYFPGDSAGSATSPGWYS